MDGLARIDGEYFAYIDFAGERRLMGLKPSDPQRMAAMPTWRSQFTVLSKQDVVDFLKRMGGHYDLGQVGSPILDQDGTNGCVGWSSAAVFTLGWNLMGEEPQRFSPSFLYAQVNGGRDAGAMTLDTIDALKDIGISPLDDNDATRIFKRQISQKAYDDAKRFRLASAYVLTTAEEMMSAILHNWPVEFGMSLPNGYQRIDPATGLPPRGNNPAMGHAQMIRGLYNHPVVSEVVALIQNSWTEQFGIADATKFGWESAAALKGCCFLTFDQIMNGYFEAWAMKVAVPDPQDPTGGIPTAVR